MTPWLPLTELESTLTHDLILAYWWRVGSTLLGFGPAASGLSHPELPWRALLVDLRTLLADFGCGTTSTPTGHDELDPDGAVVVVVVVVPLHNHYNHSQASAMLLNGRPGYSSW